MAESQHPIDRVDTALATAQEVSGAVAETIKHVRDGSNAATKMLRSDNFIDGLEHGAHWVLSGVKAARRVAPVVESAIPVAKTLIQAKRKR